MREGVAVSEASRTVDTMDVETIHQYSLPDVTV